MKEVVDENQNMVQNIDRILVLIFVQKVMSKILCQVEIKETIILKRTIILD